MITPELRYIHSPDMDEPALPSDPRSCQVLIQAMVGPKCGRGEESFSFLVATPNSLKDLPQWGRGLLLVESFDWKVARSAVENVLGRCQGEDWAAVATKIGRFADWEFDDYSHNDGDRPVNRE